MKPIPRPHLVAVLKRCGSKAAKAKFPSRLPSTPMPLQLVGGENDVRQPDYAMLKDLAAELKTSECYLMYGKANDASEDLVDLSDLNFEQKHTIRTLVRLLRGR